MNDLLNIILKWPISQDMHCLKSTTRQKNCQMTAKHVKWWVKPNTNHFALQSGKYWVLLVTFLSNKIKSIFQQCLMHQKSLYQCSPPSRFSALNTVLLSVGMQTLDMKKCHFSERKIAYLCKYTTTKLIFIQTIKIRGNI